ncbi:MAG: hypothetical protein HY562_10205 [Ignavibacteriales bacterium]|nr:hypothetical protein [Ignavibacteriales bacterium]
MDFVLWASRLMHVVSVVVWFGGLIFLNVVMLPVSHHEGESRSKAAVGALHRFNGFVWSSLWTALITGLLLMLLSPRFLWFEYSTLWQKLLAAKQVAFLLAGFFSWQTAKVVGRMEETQNEPDAYERWRLTYVRLIRRTIFCGIVGFLSAAGMEVL